MTEANVEDLRIPMKHLGQEFIFNKEENITPKYEKRKPQRKPPMVALGERRRESVLGEFSLMKSMVSFFA